MMLINSHAPGITINGMTPEISSIAVGDIIADKSDDNNDENDIPFSP